MKEITDKLNFIKIKNICFAKHNVKKIGGEARGWEVIFAKYTSDKGFIPNIQRTL